MSTHNVLLAALVLIGMYLVYEDWADKPSFGQTALENHKSLMERVLK